MTRTLKQFIESNLSPLGILELVDEKSDKFWGCNLLYSLSLNDVTPEFLEIETIDIEVSYNDCQKGTYSLGKFSYPFYVNSKDQLKYLLEHLIDLPLPFSVNYKKVQSLIQDRYIVSIEGVETTKIAEFVAMIKVMKAFLNQIYHKQLDK